MKKALWLIALFIGFSLTNVQAQDEQQTETTVQIEENEVDVETETDATVSTERERSRFGNFLHETGSAIGSGAKWTGKKIGQGASWTWNKAKHNKATKEVFDQPGDKDSEDVTPEVEVEVEQDNM